MSYDVDIGDFQANYTSNLASLFHDHIFHNGKSGLQSLDGLTGLEVCQVLTEAFNKIEEHEFKTSIRAEGLVGSPHFCKQYDPQNGWGSTVGGLIFLAQILAACSTRQGRIFRVYA